MNKYPALSPRCWHGMRLGDYLRLLGRNRFRIHPFRWAMAAILLPVTAINSVLAGIQEIAYGRQIRRTRVEQPPLFVIGHWRTGTTYLHRLLACDDRFAFSTLFECIAANHFVLTAPILTRLLRGLLPRKRPMDNVQWAMDLSMEDECAQLAMGGPSLYYRMAFPNRPPPYLDWLDMDGVSAAEVECFRRGHTWFLQALTYHKRKRLLLKSPTHTGRVELLSQMFPGARFVHITRHPYDIFPSTRRTWESLDRSQGFQRPHHKQLDEFILAALPRMYGGFQRQRRRIDPAHICDLRYEDLVSDPVGQLEAVYAQLELPDFEHVRPALEEHLAASKGYRRNEHVLDPEVKAQIDRRWACYFEAYGYTAATSSV